MQATRSTSQFMRERHLGRLRGFTLIELMVTILIIAILAGVFLGALQKAQQTANIAHTKALITKLHSQLMLRYESYRTRRLPIDTSGMSAQQAAAHRLNAIRELMRMEMPDRYADMMTAAANPSFNPPFPSALVSPPIVATGFVFDGTNYIANTSLPAVMIQPTTVNLSYQRRFNSNTVNGNLSVPTAQYEDAECLYLIITSGVADDTMASEQIAPADIGDVDGDGMPEFIDAWGMPIRFLRWAPGFISDLQPAIQDPTNKHDPFDPLKLQHPFYSTSRTKNDLQRSPVAHNTYEGIALYPLIYSAGPDRIADIKRPPRNGTSLTSSYALPSASKVLCCQFYFYMSQYMGPPGPPSTVPHLVYNPYNQGVLGNDSVLVGAATDVDGLNDEFNLDYSDSYDDNIHNHLIGQ